MTYIGLYKRMCQFAGLNLSDEINARLKDATRRIKERQDQQENNGDFQKLYDDYMSDNRNEKMIYANWISSKFLKFNYIKFNKNEQFEINYFGKKSIKLDILSLFEPEFIERLVCDSYSIYTVLHINEALDASYKWIELEFEKDLKIHRPIARCKINSRMSEYTFIKDSMWSEINSIEFISNSARFKDEALLLDIHFLLQPFNLSVKSYRAYSIAHMISYYVQDVEALKSMSRTHLYNLLESSIANASYIPPEFQGAVAKQADKTRGNWRLSASDKTVESVKSDLLTRGKDGRPQIGYA